MWSCRRWMLRQKRRVAADDDEVAGEAEEAAVDHEGVAHATPFDTGGAGQRRVVIGGRVVEELDGD